MKIIYSIIILCAITSMSFGQEVVFLKNPSFEDIPGYGAAPPGWEDCGFINESPPDVHPMPDGGAFGVTKTAIDGNTYLGLVVRDNQTWEATGQYLHQPLDPEQCYSFKLALCQSDVFNSISKITMRPANYVTHPIMVRIWGGQEQNHPLELLSKSPPIKHFNWIEYEFLMKPKAAYRYLTIEAYYIDELTVPYNGNVLIDKASPLVPVHCENFKALVNIDSVEIPKIVKDFVVPRNMPQNRRPRNGMGYAVMERKINDYASKIAFAQNSGDWKDGSKSALDEIVSELKIRSSFKLIIGLASSSSQVKSERQAQLTKFLKAHKLSKKQYKIVPLEKSSYQKLWLSESENLKFDLQVK